MLHDVTVMSNDSFETTEPAVYSEPCGKPTALSNAPPAPYCTTNIPTSAGSDSPSVPVSPFANGTFYGVPVRSLQAGLASLVVLVLVCLANLILSAASGTLNATEKCLAEGSLSPAEKLEAHFLEGLVSAYFNQTRK